MTETSGSETSLARDIPETMCAVRLNGHGDFSQYEFRSDVLVPRPGHGEILIRVEAAALNNTDVAVRTDWYAGEVAHPGFRLPRIQGADVAGSVVAVGPGVAPVRVGERVICDPALRPGGELRRARADKAGYLGFDTDGGFAEFVVVPGVNAWSVPGDLPAEELAAYPVAYSTALEMIRRGGVRAGDRMVVTGASGGVGVALVQLGKALRLDVIAVASGSKADCVRALGADVVVDRHAPNMAEALQAEGVERVDLVADVVGGDQLASFLDIVRDGGRCVTAGAIGGPRITIDLRHLIYKDVDLRGVSTPSLETFAMLVDLIAARTFHAPVAAVYPLAELVQAQRRFVERNHVGKIVLSVATR